MNRLVFIIPFYNVSSFIKECADSLINQTYKNWIAIFVDDCSTDGTINNIPADDRFKIIKNTERVTALPNIHNAIVNSSLNDEDIICLLDGDDKLSSNYACQIVDDFYKRYNPLLSYGQYVTSNNQMGHCIPYTQQTFTQLRTGGYWASHLRTFKYKLYKEIMNQDPNLSCYKDANGNFYKMTYDVCIMLPLMEMAGLNNIYFNNIPIYFYRLHSNNDHAINMQLQYGIANEVYAKKKFNQVF